MKTSNRDKILILFLPSLLVAVLYWQWIASPLGAEVTKASKELAALKSRPPAEPLIMMKTAQVSKLHEELAQCQKDKQQLEAQWQALAGINHGTGRRPDKIETLTAVLNQYGLIILEQAQAETSKDANLPGGLNAVVQRLKDTAGPRKPEVWRYRVQGSYAGLLRVLHQLSSGEAAVVPLSVTMKETDLHSDVREWTLLLWI